MPLLYLLSEDDNDDLFYEACLEKITGQSFQPVNPRRIRTGGGLSEVRKKLGAFANDLKAAASVPHSCFVVAMDCDRARDHFNNHEQPPNLSKQDRLKNCRVCEIQTRLTEILGHDRSKWPAQGAIAVPVQMLESWALLGIDPSRESRDPLPIFAEKAKSAARDYHAENPPAQLKDLLRVEQKSRGFNNSGELLLDIIENLDPGTLAEASPSFADFYQQVSHWEFGD